VSLGLSPPKAGGKKNKKTKTERGKKEGEVRNLPFIFASPVEVCCIKRIDWVP
jgi:hypothetical protein